MNRTITYGQLEKFLLGLGFKRLRAPGSHVYFDHAPSKAAVVVKDYASHEELPAYKLSAARETLHYFGLLDREEFDAALENACTPAKAG
jgi:predicted RNA binding protein YcfA (HicA-like mRNA interferase family)